jgi:hypothetical protein
MINQPGQEPGFPQQTPIEDEHFDDNASNSSDEEGNMKKDKPDEDVAQGYPVL